MPRRISDYPDAFAGWNIISSFGSIISVVATWLFLYIVYVQLVEGRATSRYPWLTPQFYSDSLQTLLNRSYNSLEWALNSPPKPHAFVSLPLQSSMTLTEIFIELGQLLPQLDKLIDSFHTIVNTNNIAVISDGVGNLSIDVPGNMPDAKALELQERIGLVDILINKQGAKIHDLFQQGQALEEQLKSTDSNYTSQLTAKLGVFNDLKLKYGH